MARRKNDIDNKEGGSKNTVTKRGARHRAGKAGRGLICPPRPSGSILLKIEYFFPAVGREDEWAV